MPSVSLKISVMQKHRHISPTDDWYSPKAAVMHSGAKMSARLLSPQLRQTNSTPKRLLSPHAMNIYWSKDCSMTVGLTIRSAETRDTETALFIPQSFESKTADTTAHSVYSVIHTPGMMRFPDSAFMYRVSQRPQASAQSPAPAP